MVPRKDLFAAFSVARSMQQEIEVKNDTIRSLNHRVERSRSNLNEIQKGATVLLNALGILFSGLGLKASQDSMDTAICDQTFSKLNCHDLDSSSAFEQNVSRWHLICEHLFMN